MRNFVTYQQGVEAFDGKVANQSDFVLRKRQMASISRYGWNRIYARFRYLYR